MGFLKILIYLLAINSVAFSQSQTLDKHVCNNDSIYYMVHLVIEGYSRTEMITLRKVNSLYYANIDVQSSLANDNFKISNMLLNNSQIDSLANFENSIHSRKIKHNQGLRFAGRLGRYSMICGNKKYDFESRELYGLIAALEIKK